MKDRDGDRSQKMTSNIYAGRAVLESTVQEGEGVKFPQAERKIEREGNLAFRHSKAFDLSVEREH